MCCSFNASITSYVIGMTTAIYLIYRNLYLDSAIGYFMLYIIQIQGLEALMWYDDKCTGINQFATKLAIVQNLFQPIVAFLIFYNFYSQNKLNSIKLIMLLFVIVLPIYFYFYIYQKSDEKGFFCTLPSSEHNLTWNWTSSDFTKFGGWFWFIFCFALIYPFFNVRSKTFSLIIGIYVTTTLLISGYLSPKTKATGSWWCLAAVLIPVIKILVPPNLLKN